MGTTQFRRFSVRERVPDKRTEGTGNDIEALADSFASSVQLASVLSVK